MTTVGIGSLHHVSFGNQTQVIRLVGKHLYPLSYLTGPDIPVL